MAQQLSLNLPKGRAKKPAKLRQTPCTACAGFKVPARKVKSVARDRFGRFKRK